MRQHICPPDHKHGATPTCYREHKCGCTPCRAANAERSYTRNKLIAYGRWEPETIDATRARTHLIRLLDAGFTTGTITNVTGIDNHEIHAILYGRKRAGRYVRPSRRIFRRTAEKILAVAPDLMKIDGAVRISSRGARRRVQALATMGWSRREIARKTGIPSANIDALLTYDLTTAHVHQTIATFYDAHWNRKPATDTRAQRVGYTRALSTAEKHQWASPLAWDDIDTDPTPVAEDTGPAAIDSVAIELALAGQSASLTREEKVVAVHRGVEAGMSYREVAEALDISVRTVDRYLAEEIPAEGAA